MSRQTITVRIREHSNARLDEEGTITRSASVATRAEAQRWLKRHLALVDPESSYGVGEATEYEDDPLDGAHPVAWGYIAPGDERMEWF